MIILSNKIWNTVATEFLHTWNGVVQNDTFSFLTNNDTVWLTILYNIMRDHRISAMPDINTGPLHTTDYILGDVTTTVFRDCNTGSASRPYEIVSTSCSVLVQKKKSIINNIFTFSVLEQSDF